MPDRDFNLYAFFANQFRSKKDQVLLRTDRDATYSYRDVDRLSSRMASFLFANGVSPGDRVSVCVRKSPQALCLYLACLRAGFVYQPINPDCKPTELDYFLTDADPKVFIRDTAPEIVADKVPSFSLDADGADSLIKLARDAAEDFPIAPSAKDDLAALPYSSGTTGRPKGIMLTHGNLRSNIRTLTELWDFREDDCLLHALPISHVHGLFVAIGCVLSSGASMCWLPSFDASQVIRFLPGCTVMMGVPTYYTRLLAHNDFSADTCRNMRVFISGSAPLLEETFAEFEARTGHRILERYGMTETCMNTSNPLRGLRKPGTVGLPLPGVEIRVVDADAVSELQVRGPNVFSGYWNMPGETAEDFTKEGFFNTGDLAKIDGDGYISIVGRAKDLVITGGVNVYPKEVERFIDGLAGVRESAVIGVPHADFGEAVVAVVVPDGGADLSEETIIQAAKDDLANYKVPKRVVFIDELPRNAMAKVQKNSLREACANLFE